MLCYVVTFLRIEIFETPYLGEDIMKIHRCLGLLTLSLLLASATVPVPAAAMSSVSAGCKGHKDYTGHLDKLGPVESQDTIEYDDSANA